jgi:hypothetical protein
MDTRVGFWLLAGLSLSDPDELAYYACFAPAATSLVTLVGIAGRRCGSRRRSSKPKGEVGLDHYQVRQHPACTGTSTWRWSCWRSWP